MIRTLSNSKFLIPAMIVLATSAAAAGFYISLKQSQQALQAPADIQGLFWPEPKQINAFKMLDQQGKPFTEKQFSGQWSLIFFGYTHCPDVCPVTLSVMADVYNELVPKDKNVQVIFTTVDPERDTTEKLQNYVSYFHKDFIGLGGDTTMVNSLVKQIGIAYYLNNEDGASNYLVDHTASIFVFDPQGRLVGKLSAPHQKTDIIEKFTKIKNFITDHS